MKVSKRTATLAATVAALIALTGCTTASGPESTGSNDSAETTETTPDLSTALLQVSDLDGLTEEYGEFEEAELSASSSDTMINGDPSCADFLDSTYATEELDVARIGFQTEYQDKTGEETAYLYALSSVREFADADAASNALDELRGIFSTCNEYVLKSGEDELTMKVLDFNEALEHLNLGDEAVTLGLSEEVGVNLTAEYAHLFTRIDNLIVTSSAYKWNIIMPISLDLMLEITEPAIDRANDYLEAS